MLANGQTEREWSRFEEKNAAAAHSRMKMPLTRVTDKVPMNIKSRLPAGPLAQRNLITSAMQECLIPQPKAQKKGQYVTLTKEIESDQSANSFGQCLSL